MCCRQRVAVLPPARCRRGRGRVPTDAGFPWMCRRRSESLRLRIPGRSGPHPAPTPAGPAPSIATLAPVRPSRAVAAATVADFAFSASATVACPYRSPWGPLRTSTSNSGARSTAEIPLPASSDSSPATTLGFTSSMKASIPRWRCAGSTLRAADGAGPGDSEQRPRGTCASVPWSRRHPTGSSSRSGPVRRPIRHRPRPRSRNPLAPLSSGPVNFWIGTGAVLSTGRRSAGLSLPTVWRKKAGGRVDETPRIRPHGLPGHRENVFVSRPDRPKSVQRR